MALEATKNEAAARRRNPRRSTLPSGQALTLEQATREAAGRRARVIVLVGPVASGKTTLLSAVYEGFGGGRFFGYSFAGSETLVAFEARCHESRLTSGLDVATTARTARGDPSALLHLAVTAAEEARTHVFVNDISGEIFEDVLRRPATAAHLPIIAQADRLQVLLNGEILCQPGARDFEVYRVTTMARAIIDHGNLKPDAAVDVIVTKADLLQDSGTRAFANRMGLQVQASLPSRYAGAVMTVCARTSNPTIAATFEGMAPILATWTGRQAPAEPTDQTNVRAAQ